MLNAFNEQHVIADTQTSAMESAISMSNLNTTSSEIDMG